MSSLTSVVKARAVVDDRQSTFVAVDASPVQMPVLKSGGMLRGMPAKSSRPLTKDEYQDQLNRIRVQIAQSTEELQKTQKMLAETRAELGDAQSLLQIDVEDADAKAEYLQSVLSEAQTKADAILSAAHAQRDAIEEEARQKGYQEGYDAGIEESRAAYVEENAPKAEELERLIERLSGYHREQVAENDYRLVDLSIAIARRILHREITADPKALVDMLYEIIDENRREDSVRITLAKDLLPIDMKASQEVKEMLCALGADIAVITDDGLADGACIVETRKGIVDLGLETQLVNMASALKQE